MTARLTTLTSARNAPLRTIEVAAPAQMRAAELMVHHAARVFDEDLGESAAAEYFGACILRQRQEVGGA